jgi:hypothetical protein
LADRFSDIILVLNLTEYIFLSDISVYQNKSIVIVNVSSYIYNCAQTYHNHYYGIKINAWKPIDKINLSNSKISVNLHIFWKVFLFKKHWV